MRGVQASMEARGCMRIAANFRDPTLMPHQALTDAISCHGALGAEGAIKYVKEMEASGRLFKELWS